MISYGIQFDCEETLEIFISFKQYKKSRNICMRSRKKCNRFRCTLINQSSNVFSEVKLIVLETGVTSMKIIWNKPEKIHLTFQSVPTSSTCHIKFFYTFILGSSRVQVGTADDLKMSICQIFICVRDALGMNHLWFLVNRIDNVFQKWAFVCPLIIKRKQ